MGNDNSLLIVVIAALAYFILTAKAAEEGRGSFGASLFGATAKTPAGTVTSTGAIGAAKEIASGSCLEYIFNPIMFSACIAGKTTTLNPISSAPQPQPAELCPCNDKMLIHDRRCCQPEQTGGYSPGVFAGFSPQHQEAYR